MDWPRCIRAVVIGFVQCRLIRNYQIDLDFATHAVIDDLKRICRARRAAKYRSIPIVSGVQLEWARRYLSAGRAMPILRSFRSTQTI
jgi:hypothetical protein